MGNKDKKGKERLSSDLDLKIWLLKWASREHCWIIYQRWAEILAPVREKYPDLQLHTVYSAHVEPKTLSTIVADTKGHYYWINSHHVDVELSDEEAESGSDSDGEDDGFGGSLEEEAPEASEASEAPETEQTEGIEMKGEKGLDDSKNAEGSSKEDSPPERHSRSIVDVYVTTKDSLHELLLSMKISDRTFLRILPDLRHLKLNNTDRARGAKQVALLEGLDTLRHEYLQKVVAVLGEESGHQSLGEIGNDERLTNTETATEREALFKTMQKLAALNKERKSQVENVSKDTENETVKTAQAEVDQKEAALQTAVERTQEELRTRRATLNQRLVGIPPPEGLASFWRAWMDYALLRRNPLGSKRTQLELEETFILDLGELVSLPSSFLLALPEEYTINRLIVNQNYQLVRDLRWTERFPSLQELTFANCGELDNPVIEELVQRCPHLYQFGMHLCPRPNFRFFLALMKMKNLNNVLLNQPNLTCQTNAYFGVLKEEEWQAAEHRGELQAPVKKLLINSRNMTLDVLDILLRFCPQLERVVLDHALWTKLQKSFVHIDNDTKGRVTFATFNGTQEFSVQRPFKLTNLMKESYQEPFSAQMSSIASNVIANEECGLEELNYEELRELEAEVLRELEEEAQREAAAITV